MSVELEKRMKVLREVYEANIVVVAACYNSDIVDQLIGQVCKRVKKEQEDIRDEVLPLRRGEWPDGTSIDQQRWNPLKRLPLGSKESEESLYILGVERLSSIAFAQERNKFFWHWSDGLSICYVPGIFEIPQAARLLASRGLCDAVIALGCAIRGETAHFDAIAEACTDGLNRVAQDFTMPVAHGVLLTNDREQAKARVGNEKDRGGEAASAVMQMLRLTAEVDLTTRESK